MTSTTSRPPAVDPCEAAGGRQRGVSSSRVSGEGCALLLAPSGGLSRRTPLRRGGPLQRRTPLRSVSPRRAAEARRRRELIAELFGGITPPCARPGCTRQAVDIHEPLTRARGGSITDPGNWVPLCRPCHDEITLGPAWAYEAGLLIHSWDGER